MSQQLYARRNRMMPLAFLNTQFGRRCYEETYCGVCCWPPKATTLVVQPPAVVENAFSEKLPLQAEPAVLVTQLRPRRGGIAKLPSLRTRRAVSLVRRRTQSSETLPPPGQAEVEKYSKRPLPPTPTTSASVKECLGPDPMIFNNLAPSTPDDIPTVAEYLGLSGSIESTQASTSATPSTFVATFDSDESTGKAPAWQQRLAKRAEYMLKWLQHYRED